MDHDVKIFSNLFCLEFGHFILHGLCQHGLCQHGLCQPIMESKMTNFKDKINVQAPMVSFDGGLRPKTMTRWI